MKEFIYKLYEKGLKRNFKDLKNYNSNKPVEIGNIYMGNLDERGIFFVVVDKIGKDYFECFKMSPYWELGSINDILYEDEFLGRFIIQTSLNFYLNSNEIKRFKNISKLNKEFVEKLLNYREMDIESKLKYKQLKRGLYYPLGNKWIEKFKEKELDLIQNYHLRIFTILDELEEEA